MGVHLIPQEGESQINVHIETIAHRMVGDKQIFKAVSMEVYTIRLGSIVGDLEVKDGENLFCSVKLCGLPTPAVEVGPIGKDVVNCQVFGSKEGSKDGISIRLYKRPVAPNVSDVASPRTREAQANPSGRPALRRGTTTMDNLAADLVWVGKLPADQLKMWEDAEGEPGNREMTDVDLYKTRMQEGDEDEEPNHVPWLPGAKPVAKVRVANYGWKTKMFLEQGAGFEKTGAARASTLPKDDVRIHAQKTKRLTETSRRKRFSMASADSCSELLEKGGAGRRTSRRSRRGSCDSKSSASGSDASEDTFQVDEDGSEVSKASPALDTVSNASPAPDTWLHRVDEGVEVHASPVPDVAQSPLDTDNDEPRIC